MKINFDHDDQSFSVDLTPIGKSYRIDTGETSVEAQILSAKDGRLELLIDGRHATAYISSDNTRHWVTVNGRTLVFNKSTGRRQGAGGDTATKGETLLLGEAVKMEIRIQSPQNGVVRTLPDSIFLPPRLPISLWSMVHRPLSHPRSLTRTAH